MEVLAQRNSSFLSGEVQCTVTVGSGTTAVISFKTEKLVLGTVPESFIKEGKLN